MGKYSKKQENESGFTNSTNPQPVRCDSCGYELQDDETNKDVFVYYLQCEDMNRNLKVITGYPGEFCKFDSVGKNVGNSSNGYALQDKYRFKNWVTWCVDCHAKKTKLQYNERKTNNLITSGKVPALSIQDALKKLHNAQSMGRNSR